MCFIHVFRLLSTTLNSNQSCTKLIDIDHHITNSLPKCHYLRDTIKKIKCNTFFFFFFCFVFFFFSFSCLGAFLTRSANMGVMNGPGLSTPQLLIWSPLEHLLTQVANMGVMNEPGYSMIKLSFLVDSFQHLFARIIPMGVMRRPGYSVHQPLPPYSLSMHKFKQKDLKYNINSASNKPCASVFKNRYCSQCQEVATQGE